MFLNALQSQDPKEDDIYGDFHPSLQDKQYFLGKFIKLSNT